MSPTKTREIMCSGRETISCSIRSTRRVHLVDFLTFVTYFILSNIVHYGYLFSSFFNYNCFIELDSVNGCWLATNILNIARKD
jgi:hypothetical protein